MSDIILRERGPRYGILKALIGSSHMVKGPDGVLRQFEVVDKTRQPKLKAVCMCLKCAKTYDTEATMRAAHPEEPVLRRQQEAHTFAWFSSQPKVEGVEDPGQIVGLLSDEYPEA